MKLRTNIDPIKTDFNISYQDPLFMIGSCFTVEIGQKLSQLAYQVVQNPFGITFNSASILSCIRACISGNSLLRDEVFFQNSLWCHSSFHSDFSDHDKSVVQSKIDQAISATQLYLQNVKIVAMTLGTAYVYEDTNCRQIVNNCHKRPASHFERKCLGPDEILDHLEQSAATIDAYSHHEVYYIITVSPVRHIKDGMIENQRSKSHCITAAQAFCDSHPKASYFPSYEIMMDDLRDYRFYKSDLIHPSEVAVDYIYDAFEKSYLRDEDKHVRKEITGIQSGLRHRPRFPSSAAHLDFEKNLKGKIAKIKREHPTISFPF